jgi:hypothetical protein
MRLLGEKSLQIEILSGIVLCDWFRISFHWVKHLCHAYYTENIVLKKTRPICANRS